MFTLEGKYTEASVMVSGSEVEPACIAQIVKMTNNPAFTQPIVIMPDTHAGKGSVIGFTMPFIDKVAPNIIGVDIGCGVISQKLNILEYDRAVADEHIRNTVPFGFQVHDQPLFNKIELTKWLREVSDLLVKAFQKMQMLGLNPSSPPTITYDWFKKKCEQIGAPQARVENSLGTLGGGNHFIEVGRDSAGGLWVTIHSGSRNLGKCVCDFWQNRAITYFDENIKEEQKKYIDYIIEVTKDKTKIAEKIREYKNSSSYQIVDKELRYLEGDDMFGYLYDMVFAQAYASTNRKLMLRSVIECLGAEPVEEAIESVHNYINFEDLIIRKGAIASYVGKKMVIPYNMEDGILVCEGKSNVDWNYSAPHGAGRIMSRSEAKQTLNLSDHENSMKEKDIFTSVLPLDEVKGAYKDPSIIEEAIAETAIILDRIIPIHNLKA